MGPSGCGKTTLLNILSRRLKSNSVTGTQLLSGSPFDDTTLRAISTYVEQEDHLIGSLTVRETVEFAAKLALPANITGQERRKRTEDMWISDLQMSKTAKSEHPYKEALVEARRGESRLQVNSSLCPQSFSLV